ncbi:MAG: hypothetical protein ACM3OC_08555 [Deltaproteobacteria bacterium]
MEDKRLRASQLAGLAAMEKEARGLLEAVSEAINIEEIKPLLDRLLSEHEERMAALSQEVGRMEGGEGAFCMKPPLGAYVDGFTDLAPDDGSKAGLEKLLVNERFVRDVYAGIRTEALGKAGGLVRRFLEQERVHVGEVEGLVKARAWERFILPVR